MTLTCGCGLPAVEQGFNLGRVVSILARLDVPGTTVNRYCASSLKTTRMAFHAIREGEAFVSVAVECVSRYPRGYSDPPAARNPRLLPRNAEEYPDIYITMGQTAEKVADREGITRGGDRPPRRQEPGAGRRRARRWLLRPGDHPGAAPQWDDHTHRHDGPRHRPNTAMEVLATLHAPSARTAE